MHNCFDTTVLGIFENSSSLFLGIQKLIKYTSYCMHFNH